MAGPSLALGIYELTSRYIMIHRSREDKDIKSQITAAIISKIYTKLLAGII